MGFAAAGLLLVLALCLGYGLNQARKERNRARAQRDRAQLEAHVADMKIADGALRENNLGQAMRMLRRHIPAPGQPDRRGIQWRYLWQECQGEQTAIYAHKAEVSCAALSPDGRWLATKSEGKFWV